MSIDDHNLYREFPEFSERIEFLWHEDQHFATAADEYHALDKQIRGLQMSNVPVSDFFFEDLKKRRCQLKDEIYGMLASPFAPSRSFYSQR